MGHQQRELVWIQDPQGKLHYGKLLDEDNGEDDVQRIMRFVGDPVFGFRPTQHKVDVVRIVDREVKLKGTFCKNPILLLGSANTGKTALCEMLVNHHFPER